MNKKKIYIRPEMNVMSTSGFGLMTVSEKNNKPYADAKPADPDWDDEMEEESGNPWQSDRKSIWDDGWSNSIWDD